MTSIRQQMLSSKRGGTHGAQDLAQLTGAAGTDNRRGYSLLGEHPCQRHLSQGFATALCPAVPLVQLLQQLGVSTSALSDVRAAMRLSAGMSASAPASMGRQCR